jgi:hypothetical protein
MEGSVHGVIEGTTPAFAWKDCGKPQKTSVTIASSGPRFEPETS